MKIIRYQQGKSVCLSQMYVCGNLHRFVIEPWERGDDGQWQPRGEWFDSMSEAVVWALSKGFEIDNWEECKEMLEMESECRLEWEEWMRGEMVRQIFPPVPIMIGE
jgi:hypothetical protein